MQRFLDSCEKWVGYCEKEHDGRYTNPPYKYYEDKTADAGSNNFNRFSKIFDDYMGTHKDGYSWCATFVCANLIETYGFETAEKLMNNTLSAGCYWITEAFKSVGKFDRNPKKGDLVIFGDDDHIGVVIDVIGDQITDIEGNTSGSCNASNGGCVWKKVRFKDDDWVKGYCHIDWNILKKEEDDDMTQEQFNEMFAKAMEDYRKKLQDNDAGSYSADSREWAISSGLIKGSDPLPDGSPNYMWEDFMTREQFVTVLNRYNKMK